MPVNVTTPEDLEPLYDGFDSLNDRISALESAPPDPAIAQLQAAVAALDARVAALENPIPPPPARALLDKSDFVYLGWYDLVDGNTEGGLGRGLSHRYVDGELRFMFLRGSTGSPLREFTLPASFGLPVVLKPNLIDALGGISLSGQKAGIWYEQSRNRLWINQAIDYPTPEQREYTSAISTRVISGDGSVSERHGFWGFENIGQRAIYGGVRSVPAWFRTACQTGEYVAGFGGYTSIMSARKQPSIGPMMVFFSDPHGVEPEAASDGTGGIPATRYKIGADFRSGSGSNDYGTDYANRSLDRGSRKTTTVVNWFGNKILGEASRPIFPDDLVPVESRKWWFGENGGAAPNDPYGYSRFTWGDTYNGCFEWIDNDAGTRSKHGICMVASLRDGYVWYQTSDLRYDGVEYEIHIFDPSDVAAVIAGTLAPYKLQPRNAWSIKPEMEGLRVDAGAGSTQSSRQATGTTFDHTTNRLYVSVGAQPNGTNKAKARIYVYEAK